MSEFFNLDDSIITLEGFLFLLKYKYTLKFLELCIALIKFSVDEESTKINASFILKQFHRNKKIKTTRKFYFTITDQTNEMP